MKNNLEILVGVVTLVVIIIGGYMYLESRYALKNQLLIIETKLDIQTISKDYSSVQNRIWSLEEDLTADPQNKVKSDELRDLEIKLKTIDDDIQRKKDLLMNLESSR